MEWSLAKPSFSGVRKGTGFGVRRPGVKTWFRPFLAYDLDRLPFHVEPWSLSSKTVHSKVTSGLGSLRPTGITQSSSLLSATPNTTCHFLLGPLSPGPHGVICICSCLCLLCSSSFASSLQHLCIPLSSLSCPALILL